MTHGIKAARRGTVNGSCKLTPFLILEIRRVRHEFGWSYDRIAAHIYIEHDVDISPQQIGSIIRGERWGWFVGINEEDYKS